VKLKGCYTGSGLSMNQTERLLPSMKAECRMGLHPALLSGFSVSFLCKSEINNPGYYDPWCAA